MPDTVSLLCALTRLKNTRMHLGVCGSVAAYKTAELLRHLLSCGVHVSATLSEAATKFVTPLLFEALGAAPVYTGMFQSEDPFAHLEPGQHADALFVVPASASTISRMACADASTMLSAQALAFDKTILVAPAMNPRMWGNPGTQENVQKLISRGMWLVEPKAGTMACGETGTGRLAPMPVLLSYALRALAPKDMQKEEVLVTMGPTREPWDGVRFWSNPSTGSMGACLALAAWLRGAKVHAIAGPGAPALLPDLEGLEVVPVTTAKEMHEACLSRWETCTAAMCSSAVADFSPIPFGKEKFKKDKAQEGFSVAFRPNPDILADLVKNANGRKTLGFAAETAPDMAALMDLARAKRARKGASLLAANAVNQSGCGFASPTNSMAVTDLNAKEEVWGSQSKADVAWDLCSWLLNL